MTSTNRAPRGLSPVGRKLWTDVTGDYELEAHELLLLLNCAQTADVVAALQAQVDADGGPVLPVELGGKPHPCLAELRQERVLLARLLTALRVPIGDEDARSQRRGIRGVYTLGRFDAS